MIFTYIKTILTFGFILLFVSACATLNKDECKAADWKLIGYEDGTKGRVAARIAQHRKACAEYGVSPNLALYNQGRAQGLHEYCIAVTGYNLGLRGSAYKGICSGYNEAEFITAFKLGQQIYREKSKLRKMKKNLAHKQESLDNIAVQQRQIEQQIIKGNLSAAKIILLLVDTKKFAADHAIIAKQIHALQAAIVEQKSYISHLKQQFNR